MPEAASNRVVIVGAGIVGVSTAIWLQREGHDVVLVDGKGVGEGASYGNGGVLASCAIVPVTVPGLIGKAPRMLLDPSQPLFMKWAYLPKLMPWLLRYVRHANASDTKRIAAALHPIIGDSVADHLALAEGTGAEEWIAPSDYLYLYKDRAAFEGDAFGWGIRSAHGLKYDELEAAQLRSYDPCFSSEIGFAVRMGEHGSIVDPGAYVKALASHLFKNGGRLVEANAETVVVEDGRVCGVRTGGETIPCDKVLIAAGAWSKPLARQLGVDIPLESERGYHVELWEPNIVPRAPVMVASGKFVITPMEGRLRLAGIVEFGGLKAPASDAPFALLEKNVRAAIPDLRWKETKVWMGHRPAPVDSIPVIGEVPGVKGAFLGFGHHHIGLTGGPKTGRILAQLICSKQPNIDLAPYAPSRFL